MTPAERIRALKGSKRRQTQTKMILYRALVDGVSLEGCCEAFVEIGKTASVYWGMFVQAHVLLEPRWRVYARSGGVCYLCLKAIMLDDTTLHTEHVVPVVASRTVNNYTDTRDKYPRLSTLEIVINPENYRLVHKKCNSKKGQRERRGNLLCSDTMPLVGNDVSFADFADMVGKEFR